MDPIRILDYPLEDMIVLIRQHRDYTRRQRATQPQPQPGPHKKSNTQDVLYRRADDSWF